jgi:predicted alpha/beta superfamily hydrolase
VVALLVAACDGGPPAPPGPDDLAGSSDLAGPSDPAGPDGGVLPQPDLAGPVTTTLRIHYPAGSHQVTVRGDRLGGWQRAEATLPGQDDTHTLTLTGLDGPIEWKPLLDDTDWSLGPNFRTEAGATVDVYPRFYSARGRVEKLFTAFSSAALGGTRAVWVYFPPGYDENTRARYPVLYLHDGQNLFDPKLAFGGNEWKVDETLDAAAASGQIRETLVVAPENAGAARRYEYTPTENATYLPSGGGPKHLAFLADELKPAVDAMLRTLPGKLDTAIGGSSLGGLMAAWSGAQRPEVFGLVLSMSPSTWWDGSMLVGAVSGAKGRPARVYVDSGTPGDGYDETRLLVDAYLAAGFVEGKDFMHVFEPGGQHNELAWARRLPAALAFLLGPR